MKIEVFPLNDVFLPKNVLKRESVATEPCCGETKIKLQLIMAEAIKNQIKTKNDPTPTINNSNPSTWIHDPQLVPGCLKNGFLWVKIACNVAT